MVRSIFFSAGAGAGERVLGICACQLLLYYMPVMPNASTPG